MNVFRRFHVLSMHVHKFTDFERIQSVISKRKTEIRHIFFQFTKRVQQAQVPKSLT